jgi:hypothetical protein
MTFQRCFLAVEMKERMSAKSIAPSNRPYHRSWLPPTGLREQTVRSAVPATVLPKRNIQAGAA